MAESPLSTLLMEQRHIFGVCPHCKSLFRLVDVGISYASQYVPDWLDKLERREDKIREKIDDLGDKEKELRRRAIEEMRRTELPRRLKTIIPELVDKGFNPQDVKTIFHPVDFIVFEGMGNGSVERVVFLSHAESDSTRSTYIRLIKQAIDTENYLWQTARIDDSGSVTIK